MPKATCREHVCRGKVGQPILAAAGLLPGAGAGRKAPRLCVAFSRRLTTRVNKQVIHG